MYIVLVVCALHTLEVKVILSSLKNSDLITRVSNCTVVGVNLSTYTLCRVSCLNVGTLS